MRRKLAWSAVGFVIAATACGGTSGPLPLDGGIGRDGAVRLDGGPIIPDAAHLDAPHADAAPLFDSSL